MKILIWGYGLEGKSALDYFLKIGKNDLYVATKEAIDVKVKNVNFILEKDIFDYNFDLVVKSSGISYYKEEVQKLINMNVKITSNLNIFLENNNSKTIAITGTKGKSTTSSILYHILKNMDYKVALVGNIGKSFLDIVDEKFDYVIMELSSYQIKTLYNTVDYGIILNLFPEHIDWHKTHENYFNDKFSLSSHSEKFICNGKNEILNRYIKNDFIEFGNLKGFYVKDSCIFYNDKKIVDTKLFTNIRGEHIFENICGILTFLKEEKIDINKALDTLHTFKTLQHRLEIFYNKNNTIFVDDSISTIPEATIEAIKTFKDNDIFLILGGYDRKQDYNKLISLINNTNNIKKVFLLGQTGKRLYEYDFKCEKELFNSIEELVESIKKENLDNKTVLLSPASPSYDMFKNFEERGSIFKKLMLNN